MHRPKSLFRFPNQFIDYWSIPHFLLGSVVAIGGRVFELPVAPLFFATLTVALMWEWLERQLHIRETTINVFSDIMMPLFAYILTAWFIGGRNVRHEQLVALLVVTIIFYGLVSYAAWRARLDRDPDFQG